MRYNVTTFIKKLENSLIGCHSKTAVKENLMKIVPKLSEICKSQITFLTPKSLKILSSIGALEEILKN
ncbi:hypothetical protein EV44_g2004 [Erysiphe necator]|uniref:Uncharacterized protein n=1 Tax=Uncinula necator TaxID=52586 RepID=A0A0B1NXB1_UNCNE|nr:hypothetical protein EV44_g2004 [Erysiphe necator]